MKYAATESACFNIKYIPRYTSRTHLPSADVMCSLKFECRLISVCRYTVYVDVHYMHCILLYNNFSIKMELRVDQSELLVNVIFGSFTPILYIRV